MGASAGLWLPFGLPDARSLPRRRRRGLPTPAARPALALAGVPSIRGLAFQAAAHGVLELEPKRESRPQQGQRPDTTAVRKGDSREPGRPRALAGWSCRVTAPRAPCWPGPTRALSPGLRTPVPATLRWSDCSNHQHKTYVKGCWLPSFPLFFGVCLKDFKYPASLPISFQILSLRKKNPARSESP